MQQLALAAPPTTQPALGDEILKPRDLKNFANLKFVSRGPWAGALVEDVEVDTRLIRFLLLGRNNWSDCGMLLHQDFWGIVHLSGLGGVSHKFMAPKLTNAERRSSNPN